jgi:4-hydroxy-2-oxoheptanedioate aldolase
MRTSIVRQRWNDGKPAFCTGLSLTDPGLCEMVSGMGFDCLWIDLEHHVYSLETAGQMMRGIRVGSSDTMLRPGRWEFMRMARMLEAGAQGILYPRCESAEEAADAAKWARFAPIGERGFDGGNPDNRYGEKAAAEYTHEANRETFLAVQVESPVAVPHTRAMAEVDGVDMVFFGPGDYCVLSGTPGQVESDAILKVREQVCRDTLRAQKVFGTLCFSDEDVRRCIDMGAMFVAYMFDMVFLRRAYTDFREHMTGLGFQFPSAG